MKAKSLGMKVVGMAMLLLLLAANSAWANRGNGPARASADIFGCTEDSPVEGTAKLRERVSEEGVKQIEINMLVKGLEDGKHAVHIHEAASCEPCGSALGHFDPGPNGNSSPDGNHPFHMGDLENIDSGHGVGTLQTTTTRVTLSDGPLSLFDENGSSFIIHINEDTYCPDGVVSGCAGGGRAACGIIYPD